MIPAFLIHPANGTIRNRSRKPAWAQWVAPQTDARSVMFPPARFVIYPCQIRDLGVCKKRDLGVQDARGVAARFVMSPRNAVRWSGMSPEVCR